MEANELRLKNFMSKLELSLSKMDPETLCQDITIRDLVKLSCIFDNTRVSGRKSVFSLKETAFALGYDSYLLTFNE